MQASKFKRAESGAKNMQTQISDFVKVLSLSALAAFAWTFLGTLQMAAQTITQATYGGPAAKRAIKDGNLRLPVEHVLILGIDGLHAFDLENYVQSHPDAALAKLKKTGLDYVEAFTSKPSDSFPGILAIVTGGSPFRLASTTKPATTAFCLRQDRSARPSEPNLLSTRVLTLTRTPSTVAGSWTRKSSGSTAAGVAYRFIRTTSCG
jgi:hypothetical protein